MSVPGTLRFPTALDDNDSLIRATNNATTTVTDNPLTSGATTINVAATNTAGASFAATGVATIENEIVIYTGTTTTSLTGVARGAFGTTAASHASGVAVNGFIIARHVTVLADALIQAETKLGTGAGINNTGASTFTSPDSASVPVTAKGTAGQSASLIEARNSANTLLAKIANLGDVTAPSYTATGPSSSSTQTTNVTITGTAITDATRTAPTEGDGVTPPDGSYGLWEATTNLITTANSNSFETNTTGWTNHSGTISRITTDAKFGTACGQYVTSNLTANEGPSVTFTGAAATQYTVSAWVKLASGAATVRVALSDSVSGKQGSAGVALSGVWQRLTVTATTGAASSGFAAYVETTVQAAGTFLIDGVQVEAKAYATPFVTNTRAVTYGQVASASSLLTATQGWVAMRVRHGHASIGGVYRGYFAWMNGTSDGFDIQHDGNQWVAEQRSTALGVHPVGIASTYAAGGMSTIFFAWTATAVTLSLNGATFVSASNSGTPSGMPASLDIGAWTGNGNMPVDADVLWFYCGTGTVTNADATTLNALGNTNPGLNTLGTTAAPQFVWTADTVAGTQYLALATAYGVDIPAITAGSTNNYGLRVAAPSGGSGENYAIKTTGTTKAIASGATNVIGIEQAASAQTANMREWRDSNNVLLSAIDSYGNYLAPRLVQSSTYVFDDFMAGTTATGLLGLMNWSWGASPTNGATPAYQAPVAGHPGVLRRDTSATQLTATTAAYLSLLPSGSTSLLPAENWDMEWIFRLNTNVASTGIRFGLIVTPGSTPALSTNQAIVIEKLAADTDFFGRCYGSAATSATAAMLGGAISTSTWYHIRLRRVDASTIGFNIKAGGAGSWGTEKTITTNVPTVAMNGFMAITNLGAAVQSTVDLDLFDLLMTSTART